MSKDSAFSGLNFDPNNLKATQDRTEAFRDKVEKLQQKIALIKASGSAGTEEQTVKVTLNGKYEAIEVLIDDKLLSGPKQNLCDLMVHAITIASHEVEQAIQQMMIESMISNEGN